MEEISVKLKRGCARKGGEDGGWRGKLRSDGAVGEHRERVESSLMM